MVLMALPVEGSVFRGTIGFFEQLGVYDVVLPFLLVFTLVFAILEKTKAYGMEMISGKEYTRKNLNAMTAFVSAFFVVASTQLVAIINVFVAQVVLLLLISVCFLMLAGSFHDGKEVFALKGGWNKFFMVIMFIGVVLIFLNAVGWLDILWDALFYRFDSVMVSSIVLVVVIVLFMFYVTKGEKKEDAKKE
jgi:hypothetical protein